MADRDAQWFHERFNTELTLEEELQFQMWIAEESQKQDRNLLLDLYDYDVRGYWKAGERPDERGHGTDRYKKPNHPTFSNESVYHNKEWWGGKWQSDGGFIPGTANLRLHTIEFLRDHFKRDPEGVEYLAGGF